MLLSPSLSQIYLFLVYSFSAFLPSPASFNFHHGLHQGARGLSWQKIKCSRQNSIVSLYARGHECFYSHLHVSLLSKKKNSDICEQAKLSKAMKQQ